MNEVESSTNPESTPEIKVPAKVKKSTKSTGKRAKMATATKKRKAKKSDNPMAVLSERRNQYAVDKKNLTAGGNPTVSIGDGIAKALAGQDVASLKKIAKENGISERFTGWEKANLNPGHLRMNLGNVLRGIARRGDAKVTVNGKSVK